MTLETPIFFDKCLQHGLAVERSTPHTCLLSEAPKLVSPAAEGRLRQNPKPETISRILKILQETHDLHENQ